VQNFDPKRNYQRPGFLRDCHKRHEFIETGEIREVWRILAVGYGRLHRWISSLPACLYKIHAYTHKQARTRARGLGFGRSHFPASHFIAEYAAYRFYITYRCGYRRHRW